MIITQRIPIIQSRRLSRKIAKCVRECDIVYDMSILMKMAHPGLSQYDLNYMTPGWRERFCLTGASLMHKAASKQVRLGYRILGFQPLQVRQEDPAQEEAEGRQDSKIQAQQVD